MLRIRPLEQLPHLAPALTALILGVVALEAFGIYARSLEYRSITALATDEAIITPQGIMAPVKNQGTALQQAALDTEGLLPVYGSSELNLLAAYNRPFVATNLFRDRPTGFTIFPIGKAGSTCLIMMQKLAAVGPALQGRKVVVSLSAFWFFERFSTSASEYAGNFSDLHAGELAFNTRLSLKLRQDAARRMLQFPATVSNRPLLRFALEYLADGSPRSLACYEAVLPLGIVHNAILRYQDHWNVVCYLWKHPSRTPFQASPPGAPPLDWPMLHRQADELYRAHSNNNEFGLDNEKWNRQIRQHTLQRRNTWSDETFLHRLEQNQEWVDLEILVRELNELGAQPLLLSMPIHGGWYDQCGVTYTARRVYYQKLRDLGARYHTAVVDFADHDSDHSFCNDDLGHLAPSGLVYYNQIYDSFFHDAMAPQAALPAAAPRRADGQAGVCHHVRRTALQHPKRVSTFQGRKVRPWSLNVTFVNIMTCLVIGAQTIGPVRDLDGLLPGNPGGAGRDSTVKGISPRPLSFTRISRGSTVEIIERIDHWGKTTPDHPAYMSGGRTLTYGELCRGSDALAAHLARSLPEKAPVIVLGHKEPELIIAYLGVIKSGRAYVPVDTAVPRRGSSASRRPAAHRSS